MKEELKAHLLAKMSAFEVGSPQHDFLLGMIREGESQVKLHKETDQVCESCQ